jgi:DNA-binding MarR family transcriptional regulator
VRKNAPPRSIVKKERYSVTSPSLLTGGNDTDFRVFIQDLFGLAGRVELVRERIAADHGISGAQLSIMMGLLLLQGTAGVGVTVLAEHLHLQSTFVTLQTNKLRERALLVKRTNPDDKRGVLLSLTAKGLALLDLMLPPLREANDAIFGDLRTNEFVTLRSAVAACVATSDQALFVLETQSKRRRTAIK